MRPCTSCGRPADLMPAPSYLDGQIYLICGCCFDNRAETPQAFARAMRDVAHWSDLDAGIRERVRFYSCGEYLDVMAWARRMMDRQLVPCDPDAQEDEELLRDILAHMSKIRRDMDTTATLKRVSLFGF